MHCMMCRAEILCSGSGLWYVSMKLSTHSTECPCSYQIISTDQIWPLHSVIIQHTWIIPLYNPYLSLCVQCRIMPINQVLSLAMCIKEPFSFKKKKFETHTNLRRANFSNTRQMECNFVVKIRETLELFVVVCLSNVLKIFNSGHLSRLFPF